MFDTSFECMPLQIIHRINDLSSKEKSARVLDFEVRNRKKDAFALPKIRNLERTYFSLFLFSNIAPGSKVINCCHNSFGSPVKDSSVV